MEFPNKLFKDLRAHHTKHHADVDDSSGCEAFGPYKSGRRFTPATHGGVKLTHQVKIYAVRELRRIFAGSDEREQRARFLRSCVGRACEMVQDDYESWFEPDPFNMVCDELREVCEGFSTGFSNLFSGQRIIIANKFVVSVVTLCQAIVLFALGASCYADWGPESIHGDLLNDHFDDDKNTAARCAVYRAVVDHQERLRFLLPSEIGFALLNLFMVVNKTRVNQWRDANSLLAGLIDDRADIEPGSPEAHVFKVITSLPLHEFLFRHAPHSHLLPFAYDKVHYKAKNSFIASPLDIYDLVGACRPHFAHSCSLSRAVYFRELWDCQDAVFTQPDRSFADIAERLVEWHSHFDFSRGWGDDASSKEGEYLDIDWKSIIMPDPLLFFVRVLLETRTKTAEECGQTCRFGVEGCALSNTLACEHESRLMQFTIWLAQLRQPCDLGTQSIRMWFSLFAALAFHKELSYGFRYHGARMLDSRECGRLNFTQFWPVLLIEGVGSAERRARCARRDEGADWQAVFSHTRTRLQPFAVELLGACSPAFVEQCELTAFGARMRSFFNGSGAHFGIVLQGALEAKDCLDVAQPLFERWKKQIFIRLLRGSTHHFVAASLWRAALNYGHTWLCEELFAAGYPAYLESEHATNFERRRTPLSLPLLVTRRMAGKPAQSDTALLYTGANRTQTEEARARLAREIRTRQGMVDSEPFWAGRPFIADCKPDPRRPEFLSLRGMTDTYACGRFISCQWGYNPLAFGMYGDNKDSEILDHQFTRAKGQEFELLHSVARSWISEATLYIASSPTSVPSLRSLCIKTVYRNGLLDLAEENAVEDNAVLVRGESAETFFPNMVMFCNPLESLTYRDDAAFERIEKIAARLELQAAVCCEDENREVFDSIYVRYAEYESWDKALRQGVERLKPSAMNSLLLEIWNSYFECMKAPSNSYDAPYADICYTLHAGCLLNASWKPPYVALYEDPSAVLSIPTGEEGKGISLEIARTRGNEPIEFDLAVDQIRMPHRFTVKDELGPL